MKMNVVTDVKSKKITRRHNTSFRNKDINMKKFVREICIVALFLWFYSHFTSLQCIVLIKL